MTSRSLTSSRGVDELRLGDLDRLEQAAGLVDGLVVLIAGDAVVDDPSSGLDVGGLADEDEGPKGDAGIHLAGEVDVADGPGAVLARIEGRTYRAIPPKIEPVNPIGSGDCLLAGLVDARLAGLEPEALLKRAVAAAVANALVWDAGAIELEGVRRLEGSVEVNAQ